MAVEHRAVGPQSKQSIHPAHPLDLPEILSLIASFLTGNNLIRDLASASLVSSSFHTAFTPYLYRTLKLKPTYPLSFQSSIERHGQHVHNLETDFMQFGILIPLVSEIALPNFRNLHTLRIYQSPSSDNPACETNLQFRQNHWQDLVALVEQNQGLTEFSIQMFSMALISVALWKALAGLPSLWTLRVYGAQISNFVDPDQEHHDQKANIEVFLEACRSVRVLDMDYTTFHSVPPESSIPSSFMFFDHTSLWNNMHLVFKNLISFSTFGRSRLDIAFFSRCLKASSHTLRQLKWSTQHHERYSPSDMAPRIAQEIVKVVNASTPPGLGSLKRLELWDGMPFSDREIADILDVLPTPLEELCIPESGFDENALVALLSQPHSQSASQEIRAMTETGGESMQILQTQKQVRRAPHSTTLRYLNLSDCPYITKEMAELIQDACPKLDRFIWSVDVV
ncbi:hypothetical protein BGX20_002321 [Mortierella sp. AD010]|nr:hypothetical protein BGX20_002321 [Mortierella sp. AD010]